MLMATARKTMDMEQMMSNSNENGQTSGKRGRISFKDMGLSIDVIWFLLLYAYADGRKVRITSLYSGKSAASGGADESPASEGGWESLFDPAARAIARALDYQHRAGLSRDYVERSEEMAIPRGRINITETIGLKARNAIAVSCTADEYLEDTVENRVLKATMKRLISYSRKFQDEPRHERQEEAVKPLISADSVSALLKRMRWLQNVSDLPKGFQIDWARIRLHRNNKEYRVVMECCRLILKLGARELHDICEEADKTGYAFEAAIRQYFKSHYPELQADRHWYSRNDEVDDRMVKNPWSGRNPRYLPRMQDDIELHGDDFTLVIDAKCYRRVLSKPEKSSDTPHLSIENCNQLFNYVCHVERRRDVERETPRYRPTAGLLLYAGCEEREWRLRWRECGHPMFAGSLNLDSIESIRKGLDAIAQYLKTPQGEKDAPLSFSDGESGYFPEKVIGERRALWAFPMGGVGFRR